MTHIQVFLRDGSNHSVDMTPAHCHANDFITWHFHVGNKDVKWVQIKFQDKKNELYFPNCPDPWKCSKAVDPKTHRALIYGNAPDGYADGCEFDKYTVRGFDGDPSDPASKEICKLDPEIVVDTP
jgi:hypothetical protein